MADKRGDIRPYALQRRLGARPEVHVARDPFAGRKTKSSVSLGVIGIPIGDPVGSIAFGLSGDNERQADRARRKFLFPDRNVADARPRDDHHGNGRRADLAKLW